MSKICFVLMKSPLFSLIIFDSASMSMMWKVGWPVSSVADGRLLVSLFIAALWPGGLDVSFCDLPIMLFKSSILSSSSIKVSTFPLIILINCLFLYPSYSGFWTLVTLQSSLRPISSGWSNIWSSCNCTFLTKSAIFINSARLNYPKTIFENGMLCLHVVLCVCCEKVSNVNWRWTDDFVRKL